MEAPPEPADEVARLRGCLNDLISVMALPALWPGREPREIVGPLIDALVGMLRLVFVFVRLNDTEGGQPIEIVRFGESRAGSIQERDIGSAIDASLGGAASSRPFAAWTPVADAELSTALAHLGVQGELGIVVAASQGADFPSQTERLLLDVAANQAAIGLQHARLLSHQKRVAEELDARVARRTGELAAANERLENEVAERRRVEAELRRAYDSFADAQRLSKTGSFITDLVGDDPNWSDETYRIFEFGPGSKITVQRLREVIHPDDLPALEPVVARAMTGVEVNFAFRIMTGRGAVKHVRGVAHLIERAAGRPMFVGALQDVTENKVAEEALNRVGGELARVSRVTALSALTASIAHEVNQPLSGIITNAGTCLRMLDADPPNVVGALETARRTIRDGNRAADVITRLRALFSKRDFSPEPVDLSEAAREVAALSLSDLRRNRIVLEPELADDLPSVAGDRIQLQQVILNLLRNAMDAMIDVHDRPRRLLIRTEREAPDRVRLTVRDAGVGLDPRMMNRLFDTFYTTKSDGMGIGLSISRSIIENHRGRLWGEPNDGPGAAFSFSIPCGATS